MYCTHTVEEQRHRLHASTLAGEVEGILAPAVACQHVRRFLARRLQQHVDRRGRLLRSQAKQLACTHQIRVGGLDVFAPPHVHQRRDELDVALGGRVAQQRLLGELAQRRRCAALRHHQRGASLGVAHVR